MDALTRGPNVIETPARSRRWVIPVVCVLVLAAIAATVWFWPSGLGSKSTSRNAANQPVPVVAAAATVRDVPVYLDGLGTVQAFNTVTIKAMVDGPLVAVNFNEGQQVHKGDVLAQIDPRLYRAAMDQAIAKKAQDEAQLANAKLDYARYQKLVANNYTSAQQADNAKAQVAQLQAQVEQDQAQIDSARTNLSYTSITAPIDGITGMRQIDEGNIVHPADTTGLLVITQMHPISVVFTLPQQTLGAVAAAMKQGQPKVLAYAQGASGERAGLLDTGTLTVLDNQVDPTTGTIKLKATFPNPDNKLWPGGFVSVRLQVDTLKNAVVVPAAAMQRGPQGAYVFLVDGNAAKREPVTVSLEESNSTVIASGLKPGDNVVVDGASRLNDGTKLTVVQPTAGSPQRTDQPSAPGTRRRTATASQ